MPVFRSFNKKVFKKWNHEMAYVLGFIAADGNIKQNKRGACFLSIQIIDKNLLENIREFFRSDHRIGIRIPKKKTEKTLYRLQIGSKEIFSDLRALGFSERKTHCMVMPQVPDSYLSSFVRGYFDGDGNVWVGFLNKTRTRPTLNIRTCFTSSSESFLRQLSQRLEDLGIKGKRICEGTYYRLYYGVPDSLRLYTFMYSDRVQGLLLNRKKEVFERYMRMRV